MKSKQVQDKQPVWLDKLAKRKVGIVKVLMGGTTEGLILAEALEDYILKHRLQDRINDFLRK